MSPPAAVRGRIDARGCLVAADPALEALQREAGGAIGEPLALPPLVSLARLVRRLGIAIARPVRVADGEFDLHLYVRATPDADAIDLAIASWDAEPARGPRPADRSIRDQDRARAVADWTWETDAALVLTALSPQARWHLGQSSDRLVGQPLAAVFRLVEDGNGRIPLLLALGAQARLERQIAELRGQRPDRFCLTAQPLFDPDGHFAGFRGIAVREVTPAVPQPSDAGGVDSVRIGEALRAQLTQIVTQAEAIGAGEQGPLRRDYADYARDIASAARHLMSLVDDLADVAVVERADFAPEREPVDLAEIGRRTAGLFAVRAADRDVTIDRSALAAPAAGFGEYRRVLQIVVNLVANAIRHAPRGTTVRLETGSGEAEAWISVVDAGAGIRAEDQERVFDKFVRLDPPAGEGSGLGLYISRRLARAMGGDLLLESRPGEGARFTLKLPVR